MKWTEKTSCDGFAWRRSSLARRWAGRLVVVCLVLGAATRPVAGAQAERPNFVFILTDDQRHDALGVVQREQGEAGRFPWLKTPNLDRLAEEGFRFRNAFVVSSLCSPSRACFLTGKYGHANGIVNNHTPLPADSVTVASLLRQQGYTTGYFGKWHMGPQRGKRPGFDTSASFVGQGRYFDCEFEIDGKPTPTKGWVDDVSTEHAEKFLREHKDKPFFLMLGFKTCHGPFQPPPRHAGTYAGETARVVPNLSAVAAYRTEGGAGPRRKLVKGDADAQGRVPVKPGYFQTITAMDENVGRILKCLEDLGLGGNTMVVFAADNGYYLGEHGLGDKRSAYEESMRIPLLVRYPRLSGKEHVIDRMVLNTDFAPTVLDYAGVKAPGDLHGRSWRGLLEGGKTDDWRRAFFYCYHYERNMGTPTVTAVRTETAKLIRYPGHDEWTEYFDLKADPFETKNLAKDPAAEALRAELDAEYRKQAEAVAFRIPEFADKPGQEATRPRQGKRKRAAE